MVIVSLLTNTATEEHLSVSAEFLGLVCGGCVLAVSVNAVLDGNWSVPLLYYDFLVELLWNNSLSSTAVESAQIDMEI